MICQKHQIQDNDALVSYGQCYVCAAERAETADRIDAFLAHPGVQPVDRNQDWRGTIWDYLSDDEATA